MCIRDRFRGGAARSSLHPFCSWCAGLGLVRATERSMEGQMSRVGNVCRRARNVTPATVNTELRFDELEQRLVRLPEDALALADEHDRINALLGQQDIVVRMLAGPNAVYDGPRLPHSQ
eukprot:4247184-Pyramimonas_sp.AAC.1